MTADSRQRELTLIRETLSLLSRQHTREILARALDALVRLTGAQRGFVVLKRGGDLRVTAARSLGQEHVVGPLHELSHTLLRRAIDTGETVLIENAREHPDFSHAESVSRLKLLSVLVTPIPHAAAPGAIYLENRRASGIFDAERAELAEAFSRLVASALERSDGSDDASRESLEPYVRGSTRRTCFGGLVGDDPRFLAVIETVAIAAQSDLPILIEGETGTGKGLLAKAAHKAGPRAKEPFVHVNCAALPDALLEDELFGHVKGAFSGATDERDGLFASADGGTLFLDEVAEMSPAMQAKLLRVVEDGVARQVGSDTPRSVDVRIISATAKSLQREVSQGRFREDLFYRLNGVTIEAPALRERRDDIPQLIAHFIAQGAGKASEPPTVSDEAMDLLTGYDYPGNVRELEAAIRRALLFLQDNAIVPAALPPAIHSADGTTATPRNADELKAALATARTKAARDIERDFLLWALEDADDNVSEAARRTGVNRTQLQQMLARHGLRGRKTERRTRRAPGR